MSATFEHPSLGMHVTEEQRDRAEQWLQQAYAEGRISELDFDQRIGQVISASTRKDLNAAFYGLVQVPTGSTALGLHPAYAPVVRPETRVQAGRGVAGIAHFSVFFTWLFGPVLFYALSRPGSYVRKEAAKAFNFQLVSLLIFVVLGVITNITDVGFFLGLWGVTWFVLTIVGGAKALQGEDWRNPVKKVIKLEVLNEK